MWKSVHPVYGAMIRTHDLRTCVSSHNHYTRAPALLSIFIHTYVCLCQFSLSLFPHLGLSLLLSLHSAFVCSCFLLPTTHRSWHTRFVISQRLFFYQISSGNDVIKEFLLQLTRAWIRSPPTKVVKPNIVMSRLMCCSHKKRWQFCFRWI